jgi:uroporphyrin-III C-methyltransferase/precorrin-2 dehydrogenase/sirohydrochlorin ferrochelatase
MGLSTAPLIARRLIEAGKDPAIPVALIENGTRPEQRVVVGTLADLPELAGRHGLVGPALIVIGEVVRLVDETVLAAEARRLAAG